MVIHRSKMFNSLRVNVLRVETISFNPQNKLSYSVESNKKAQILLKNKAYPRFQA